MRNVLLCVLLAACDGRAIGVPDENSVSGDTTSNGSSSSAGPSTGATGPSGSSSGPSTKPPAPTPAPSPGDECAALHDKAIQWIAAHQACTSRRQGGEGCTVLFLDGGFGGPGGGFMPPNSLSEPVWGCDPIAFGTGDAKELLQLNQQWTSDHCGTKQCQLPQGPPQFDVRCQSGMCTHN